MTVDELIEKLKRLERGGKITGESIVDVRNPSVSAEAMDAGSEGYHEVDEVLVPSEDRVVLLGAEAEW